MTQTFRRLPSSLIIHPENQPETAEAIYHLLACIDGGLSITTGQEAPQTITPSIGDTMGNGQWLYCRTSGSSNNPKIIRRRPASWIDSFEINRVQYGLTESDRVGVLGALDHSLSLYATMEALHVGADVYLLAGLSPRRQFRSLLESGITLLYATPTQLRLLVEASSLFQEKLPDLKLVLTGGGKLDSLCCTDLQTLCPHAKILEFYGATETSFITISDEDTPDGSVGKPFPDVKLKICDPNGLETKGVGEIWVESPYLFHSYAAGYSKDTRWQDGFLSIGEMGFIDANGNLFLKGRTSRMVTVSDQNVFLEDVETILQCDPAISLCAAIALPDKQRGHVIVAIAECVGGLPPDKQGQTALATHLQTRCRTLLGSPFMPKQIHFVDKIPLLTAGKPDLVALANWLNDKSGK